MDDNTSCGSASASRPLLDRWFVHILPMGSGQCQVHRVGLRPYTVETIPLPQRSPVASSGLHLTSQCREDGLRFVVLRIRELIAKDLFPRGIFGAQTALATLTAAAHSPHGPRWNNFK